MKNNNQVFIICDRCKKEIFGIKTKDFTGGYYTKKYNKKYFNDGENNICDTCMWNDYRYKKDYDAT